MVAGGAATVAAVVGAVAVAVVVVIAVIAAVTVVTEAIAGKWTSLKSWGLNPGRFFSCKVTSSSSCHSY
jgi:hypothetical protein